MITKSSSLFRASKICFVAGAALAALGAVGEFYPQALSSLPLFAAGQFDYLMVLAAGVAAVVAGYLLRKKAVTIQRRFEWREAYKQVQY